MPNKVNNWIEASHSENILQLEKSNHRAQTSTQDGIGISENLGICFVCRI